MSVLFGASLCLSGCGGSPTPPPTTPTTTAQVNDKDGAAESEHHRHQHHGGMAGLIAMSLKDLDLTADQKATIEKIHTDLLAKMEPARGAGKNLANTLADGVAAGAVDRTKADAAIAQLTTAMGGLHDATADALNQLHAALTPAQRTALIDKVQAHWEKWKQAHGHDEADEPAKDQGGGHLGPLGKDLGITPDETEKIRANFRGEMKGGPQTHEHKEVQDHLQVFATAFKAETFDAKTLGSESGANTHMASWGATRMARFLEAAAPVLTPDQRTKLAQTIRDRANRAD